ncbi:hypothetical protein MRB53_040079 [Persea americana]|nr:hypothetical protein MRB53_040079 [Persea americana]
MIGSSLKVTRDGWRSRALTTSHISIIFQLLVFDRHQISLSLQDTTLSAVVVCQRPRTSDRAALTAQAVILRRAISSPLASNTNSRQWLQCLEHHHHSSVAIMELHQMLLFTALALMNLDDRDARPQIHTAHSIPRAI